jgi:hypothetical protein
MTEQDSSQEDVKKLGSLQNQLRSIRYLNYLRTRGFFFFTACFFTKRTLTPKHSQFVPSRSVCKTFRQSTMAVATKSLKSAGYGYSISQRGVSCMGMAMVDDSASAINMSRGDPPSPPPNPPPSPSQTICTERTNGEN